MTEKHKVLFVCMGNICRSPTAEGIMKKIVQTKKLQDDFFIDSAGTHGWHTGNNPDYRAQLVAKKNGIDISLLQSRKVNKQDLLNFDYIIAMDSSNASNLQNLALTIPSYSNYMPIKKKDIQDKIQLMLSFVPALNIVDVPDPYYNDGFDKVFAYIQTACENLLKKIIHV